MKLLEDALKIVLDSAYEVDNEKVELNDSMNRVLAEDVFSDMDMPPFNKSAMDGYACRMEDLRNELEIIETIPAGKVPVKEVLKNQCSKIMTGSMVPKGADCVIMVEHTKETAENKIIFTEEKTNQNIAFKAEDIKTGDVVLKKGTLIKAQHIAVLASVGCAKPNVYRKIKVGVISTGSELVEPDQKPGLSQIRNSNAYQLLAQIEKIGCIPNYVGIAIDTHEASHKAITTALNTNDVILLSGGVSMGEFDFIPQILKDLNVEIFFQTLAVQPGKPTVFGRIGKKFVFGLPGNPVSSFNIFELLTKPLIYKMMGYNYKPLAIKLPLAKTYERKKARRQSFIPVKITDDGKALPLEYHGSAHIRAMVYADGLISVPIGVTKINEGELIDVRQI